MAEKTLTIKKDVLWKYSTFVLAILIVIIGILSFSGSRITGKTISEKEAGEYLLNYFEAQGIHGLSLDSIEKEGIFYKVNIAYEGQVISFYITKDGYLTGNTIISLVNPEFEEINPETQETSKEYSEEDLIKLKTFSSCLAEKGLVIYGANWCGWTKRLVVETLGGFDVASDVYVECTEEEELCSQEGIQGYPTIKINGELYSGERTLEALGKATGCVVPELEGTGATASSNEASCS